MGDLIQHLKQGQFDKLFPAGVYTNATRFLYTALLSAVDDNADTIIIKQNGFEWYVANNFIGSYLGNGMPVPSPSFNIIIHQVLEHDSIVRKHIDIISDNIEQTVLSIHIK